MKVKWFYVNREGQPVDKASAAVRRFRCACGQHGWDVDIADDCGKATAAEIQRFADAAHGQSVPSQVTLDEPAKGVL